MHAVTDLTSLCRSVLSSNMATASPCTTSIEEGEREGGRKEGREGREGGIKGAREGGRNYIYTCTYMYSINHG